MSHQTVATYTKMTEERVHRKLAAGKKTTKTDWAAGDRCAEIKRKTVHNTAAACLHYKTLHICGDSGRSTFLNETARSQEWLVLRATNAHQTMFRWLLFAKNCESSQTNRL